MSFPPPIIPQTVEQARQRDQIAGLVPVRLEDPRVELARLQHAIREHREEAMAEVNENDPGTLTLWSDRDVKLWGHLPESA